jgi:hypothetical protein
MTKKSTRRKRSPKATPEALNVRETATGYAFESVRTHAEAPRKKNIRLHQWKIDAARDALGTSTETETIEAALDLVVFRSELAAGIRAMRGAALTDVFGQEG